ncbi:MAG: hypothetical protein JNL84_14390, partial [Candidatus Accumulibacter sp.]|nr:hypothetical protein [Accumulibacter sp.]
MLDLLSLTDGLRSDSIQTASASPTGSVSDNHHNPFGIEEVVVAAAVAAERRAIAAGNDFLVHQLIEFQTGDVLFKSYRTDDDGLMHTFDQALGLKALVLEAGRLESGDRWTSELKQKVDKVVATMVGLQTTSGSWVNAYELDGQGVRASTLAAYAGNVAWMVNALVDCAILEHQGNPGTAVQNTAAFKAASEGGHWLVSQMRNGAVATFDWGSAIAVTEANLGAYAAFRALARYDATFDVRRAEVQNHLLTRAWAGDHFIAGYNLDGESVSDVTVYLDTQTWGAWFLSDVGDQNKAQLALMKAVDVFGFPPGNPVGLDSKLPVQGINYDLTAHYIAVAPADDPLAATFLQEILGVQMDYGGIPHDSTEHGDAPPFHWARPWSGVNATAWTVAALRESHLMDVTAPAVQEGTPENDELNGSTRMDRLSGFAGNDSLSGLAGDDRLNGGSGDDTLDGGPGNDTASYAGASVGVTVDTRGTDVESPVSVGQDVLFSIENLTGSDFADTLTGDDTPNTLEGGDGNDTLNGGSGDDLLDGGQGDDHMRGGDGNDCYVVDSSTDLVDESTSITTGGIDTVYSYVSYTLGANVENLRIFDSIAVNGTGNALDNVLYAGAGDNELDGGAGIDTLSYTYA